MIYIVMNVSMNVKEGPDGESTSHASHSRRGPPTTSAVTPAFAVAATGSGKRVRPAGLIDDVALVGGQVAVAQPRLVGGDGWAGVSRRSPQWHASVPSDPLPAPTGFLGGRQPVVPRLDGHSPRIG